MNVETMIFIITRATACNATLAANRHEIAYNVQLQALQAAAGQPAPTPL